MPAKRKISIDDRHVIALALLLEGASATELARRYDVSRGRLYQIADDYRDPDKLATLEDEVAFRRRIVKHYLV